MKYRTIIATVALVLLGAVSSAQAHVTLQPDSVPAGGFTRFDVRVPNETDDAATNKVEVQMPDGFTTASYEPVPGWRTQVRMESLDQPIEEHGETITQQVDTITWTATDPSAAIQPGQFRDFGLSVGLPSSAQAGDTLTFPAIQTYDDGLVVRWIGAPDSEEPAAQVTLTPPESESHGAGAGKSTADGEEDDKDEGAPVWLAIAGVVLGAGGLLAGGMALRSRPAA